MLIVVACLNGHCRLVLALPLLCPDPIKSVPDPHLSPVIAARFPPLVIQLGAFMLSAAWGLGLYAATYFALKHSHAGHQVRCPVCLSAVTLSRMLCRRGHVPSAMTVAMSVDCSTWQPIGLVPQG